MKKWIWESENWIRTPPLSEGIIETAYRLDQEELDLVESIGSDTDELVDIFSADLAASFEIENEKLDRLEIYLSVVRSLCMDIPAWRIASCRVVGESENLKATRTVLASLEFIRKENPKLDPESLLALHAGLGDGNGWGAFRTGDVFIVLGRGGNKVYEGPPAKDIPKLVRDFCLWWNRDLRILPASIGASLAHAFFVKIHPFFDGNGRVSRILMDRVLSRPFSDRPSYFRPYGISAEIIKDRIRYYRSLHPASFDSDGIIGFVQYMQEVQENALIRAREYFEDIARLRTMIARANEMGTELDNEERCVLRTMLSRPGRWTRFQATAEIEDEEKAFSVWRRLINIGLVVNGRLNLNAFSVEDQNPDTSVSNEPIIG